MILDVEARVWVKCDKCQKFYAWRPADSKQIGLLEMLTPDHIIEQFAEKGWIITEEGKAEHVECQK